MKIKALAVAVLMAAGSAQAAINPGFIGQDGELFVTIFAPGLEASYNLDLGVASGTLNDGTPSPMSYNLAADADFAQFLGRSDLRFVVAGSSYDLANDPDYLDFGVYTTSANTAAHLTTVMPGYSDLDGLTGRVASMAGDINANAIGTGQPNSGPSLFNINNSSVATVGNIGYYNTAAWNNTLGTSVIQASADVGTSIDFWHIAYDLQAAYDLGVDRNLAILMGSWTLGTDGMLTYAPVNAVPVPAAAWLFASGLLGLVGVARRKQA